MKKNDNFTLSLVYFAEMVTTAAVITWLYLSYVNLRVDKRSYGSILNETKKDVIYANSANNHDDINTPLYLRNMYDVGIFYHYKKTSQKYFGGKFKYIEKDSIDVLLNTSYIKSGLQNKIWSMFNVVKKLDNIAFGYVSFIRSKPNQQV